MKLVLRKSYAFLTDFAFQILYYVRAAGAEIARGFQEAVHSRLEMIRDNPELGQLRGFQHPRLKGLRSFRVAKPFDRILIFYRYDGAALEAIRLMHGSRNLLRRLSEPPNSPQ